jgi:hypothetical protein
MNNILKEIIQSIITEEQGVGDHKLKATNFRPH